MAEVPVTTLSIDWRLVSLLIGVAVSLLWNFLNWRRSTKSDELTKKNNSAIRFEAVHGHGVTGVLDLLEIVEDKVAEVRQNAATVAEHKREISERLKVTLTQLDLKLSRLFIGMAKSPLVKNKGRWEEIRSRDWVEQAWQAYKKCLAADRWEEQQQGLSEIPKCTRELYHEILAARADENSLE